MCSTVKEKTYGIPLDAYLIPVVTIVINFSDRKWDQPRSIHELIHPKYNGTGLMKYVPNYFINVLDPYDMEDEEIDRMESNLREVMYTVKYSSDRVKLTEKVISNSRFANLDEETANFIEMFGNIKLSRNQQGGYDMCKAIQEMKDERDKAVEDKNKAVEDKNKAVEDKNKAVEDMNKAVEDMNKAVEENKNLKARIAELESRYCVQK